MFDAIVQIVADEAAQAIVLAAIAIITTLTGLALDALRRWLGEQRVEVLRGRLSEAFDRAADEAAAKGLTEDAAVAWVSGYIKSTVADAVKGTRSTDAALAKRAALEVAARMG